MSTLLLSALGVVCPACDHHNAPRAQQCSSCATALQGRLGAAPRATSAPPAVAPASAPPAARPATAAVPPGMRPASAPKTGPHPVAQPAPPSPPNAAPIPASELVKRPPARPAPAPQPAPGPATVTAAPRFGITVVAGPAKGQRYRLAAAGAQIGRARGAILFPEDASVSPHHATLVVRDTQLFVRDEGSASGVLVSIPGQQAIPPNTLFSVGSRLFRYAGAVGPAAPASPGRPMAYGAPVAPGQPVYLVEELLIGGRPGRAVTTTGPLFTLGHAKCDFALPAEEGLAPRHCELTPSPTGALLKDLSGGLGTFVRIASGADRALQAGDRIRIGQQVLQVEALS